MILTFLSSWCWCLLVVFFHLVWALPGSCYDEWFLPETWTSLYYAMRCCILFKSFVLAVFLWHHFSREVVVLPCDCQAEVEVQVSKVAFVDIWGGGCSLLLLVRSSGYPRGLHWHGRGGIALPLCRDTIKVLGPYLILCSLILTGCGCWGTLLQPHEDGNLGSLLGLCWHQ